MASVKKYEKPEMAVTEIDFEGTLLSCSAEEVPGAGFGGESNLDPD